MPTSRKTANRHVRTRRDHSTELAEDYVEAIDEIERETGQCRVTDLARHFSVTHVTVNRTVSRLQRDGLVDTQPYAPVTLTRTGRRLAEESRRRHEVVLQFLLALGVSEEAARTDAEGIEHHVSEETLRVMKQFSENE
jgi:DtxR family manganese transport transcriptional regulator